MNRETDVGAWLAYAEADRRSAHNAMQAADYRDVAFHRQQAIEKLLKAVIVRQTDQRPPLRTTCGNSANPSPASHSRRILRRTWRHSIRTIS